MLLSAQRAILVVIDAQERLVPVVHATAKAVANIRRLMLAARRLEIPVIATERYPQGIGRTVAELAELLTPGQVVEKITFCAAATPDFLGRVEALGRDQLVIAGMEAHVCVLQTVLGMRALGWHCAVVADATSSQAPGNAELALERMRAHGADVVTTEMVLFEWLGRGGTPEFKELLPLIKSTS